ncbi:hypothetical protein INR49_011061 [Caranx melampygus]|nr:hypothetical protein INR49_011061 [Caranx melampygus]
MQQRFQDRGQRRVAPPLKNSSLSQWSTTDRASSLRCWVVVAPVREACEPSSHQTLLHIKQADRAALYSPTLWGLLYLDRGTN